jgi:hypothetical protein
MVAKRRLLDDPPTSARNHHPVLLSEKQSFIPEMVEYGEALCVICLCE